MFSDLRGARAALVGSAVLMGRSLDRQLRYGMTFVEEDSESEAFSLLLNHRVQADFCIRMICREAVTARCSKKPRMPQIRWVSQS